MIAFKSRTDWWTWPVMVAPPLAAVISIVTAHDAVQRYVGLGALGVFAVIFGGLVVPMRYLVGDELVIKAGLMRIRIPWERIERMTPSRNPLSSPALSLERLEIRYTKATGRTATILISPTDRAAFVEACARASGRHRAEGQALLPR